MCVCVLVAQLCPTLCDPMDCSSPGFSVHGILQAKILEWVAIPFSRGSSWPTDWTRVSHIVGKFFTIWATRKALCTNNFGESVHDDYIFMFLKISSFISWSVFLMIFYWVSLANYNIKS